MTNLGVDVVTLGVDKMSGLVLVEVTPGVSSLGIRTGAAAVLEVCATTVVDGGSTGVAVLTRVVP